MSGHADYNDQALRHGDSTISFGRYLVSSDFGVDVMEKGGRESDQRQKVGAYAQQNSPRWAKLNGIRRKLYENSLVLVMGTIWLGTWFAQSVTGLVAYNSEQIDHQVATLGWWHYVGTSDFWNKTLQNWQSEFLAIGSMAILAVYLRQRGSPESKPVGAPHDSTGVEG